MVYFEEKLKAAVWYRIVIAFVMALVILLTIFFLPISAITSGNGSYGVALNGLLLAIAVFILVIMKSFWTTIVVLKNRIVIECCLFTRSINLSEIQQITLIKGSVYLLNKKKNHSVVYATISLKSGFRPNKTIKLRDYHGFFSAIKGLMGEEVLDIPDYIEL